MSKRFSMLAMVCATAWMTTTSAQVDDTGLSFSYNGYLETIGGAPVNQVVTLDFTIHSDPELDAPTWAESHAGYPVTDGIVEIELGTITPIDPVLLSEPELYLGVSVDGNPEMRPRLKVQAVLRAQWARHAAHAKDVRGEVINPASIRINDMEIINAAGSWVGPPPQTAIQIRDTLLEADGAGSGLDADTLDGLSSTAFVRSDQDAAVNGTLSVTVINANQGLQVNGATIVDAGGNWLGPDTLTPAEVRAALIQVDGAGSTVDADALDGVSSEFFLRNDQDVSLNGVLSLMRVDSAQGLNVNGVTIVDAGGNWVGPDTLTTAQIRDKLIQVDGAGSNVDADILDGVSSEFFVRNDQNGTIGGILGVTRIDSTQGLQVNGNSIIDAGGNWVGPDTLSAEQIRDKLLQVDGSGSSVDADQLDGVSSEVFVRNDQDGTIGGILGVTRIDSAQGLQVNGSSIIDAGGNWLGPDTLSAEQVRDKLLQVDGSGSSVDADALDGLDSTQLLRSDQNAVLNGNLTVDILFANNNIGVNRVSPQTALDVNGSIRIGSEEACDANHAGAMRFKDQLLELCDGTQWHEILTAAGQPHGCALAPLEVDGINVSHGRILTCKDQEPIRVQIMLCGNGTVDANETCDDGNFTSDDGCNAHCQIECGDGVQGANEACDDGNTIDTDGCTSTCTIAECGDGIIQAGVEDCDGGENCLPDCTIPVCGQTNRCPVLDFVAIAGGNFNMGYAAGNSNEQPAHEVTLNNFEILRNEVTVFQYKQCVDAGICTEPKQGESDLNWGRPDREQHPVNGVSWRQARQFAQWVGADLPTEAQWEYAATSQGIDQRYPWGDEAPDCTRTHNFTCDGSLTATNCTHPTGNSSQGVCDLAGNVWEWVLDNYHNTYDGAPADGTAWCNLGSCADDGEPRVWKGGDYRTDVTRMRASARGYYGTDIQPSWMGFRLAR